VDEAGGELITMGGYAVDGMPGGFGRYVLDDYPPLAHAILAGCRLAIDDTQSDLHVGEIRDALAQLEIDSQIVLPLVRGTVADVRIGWKRSLPKGRPCPSGSGASAPVLLNSSSSSARSRACRAASLARPAVARSLAA
jgi:hypothetical protein